jgi:hypothetical protein
MEISEFINSVKDRLPAAQLEMITRINEITPLEIYSIQKDREEDFIVVFIFISYNTELNLTITIKDRP